ncbi:MAG TPA: PAS domain S-box protein [Vicinamibacterales bacterium]|nr:PAS domain S-box protein [Vicinamibacterales bacterium]
MGVELSPARPILRFPPATTAVLTALVCLGIALGLRYVLNETIGSALPFVTVFAATAAAQWHGGRHAAIAVALLGLVGCVLMLPTVDGRTRVDEVGGVLGIGAFLFTSAVIIGFGDVARAAQIAAQHRSATLRVTLHSIGDGVITTDTRGRVTGLNAVAESLTGWTHADAVGQPLDAVFRIVNEHTRRAVENPAARALREGIVVGLANHTLLVRRDGVEQPIDDSAAPIRDADGQVSGCVLVFRDVTPQRQMERERAGQLQTARTLAAIVDSSDDAIIRKRLDGTIETWNAGAERVFGHRAAEAIGRHISLVIPPERMAEEEQILATLKAGRRVSHFETERIRADGSRIWVSLTISPIADETGAIVAASKIVRDVTARVNAEAERERFVKLVENSQDFIGLCDLQGVPFFVNRAGLEMVGLESLDQARHTPVAEFFFPEDRARVLDEFFPRVLREGQGEIEIRFRHFKTGAARWMAYKVLTLTDRSGAPTGFATVSQDVTERKARADELIEADRRKNEFLAMLAHELRNPLAPLSNAVQAIQRRRPGDEHTVAVAADILDRQIRQMSRLVNDLLDASRISRGKIELRRERVALRPILEEAIETVRPLVARLEHTLTTSLPPEALYVDGDAGRLSQAIGNLLANAAKFTDKGGHIWLSAGREGDEAVIRVRDSGIGIAPEHLRMLFDMFVQVDTAIERSRDGLGIGLALVKRLVELHGGTVDAHSAGPGRGSEFTVRLAALPAAAAGPAPERRAPPAVESMARRVLVVDDSADAAASLAMLLEFEGHETYKAHDGADAVRTAERVRPDIVLMDIGLPVLNGYQACRRIRDHAWGASIVMVAITGWGQEEDREQSHAAGFDLHFVKPVDYEELLRVVGSAHPRASA